VIESAAQGCGGPFKFFDLLLMYFKLKGLRYDGLAMAKSFSNIVVVKIETLDFNKASNLVT
jgi:hypothetical protein